MKSSNQPEQVTRVRTPKGKEMLGIIEEMLGGGRFRVKCRDKNTRICRVSGKFKKKQWIRPGDVVLLEPWEVESDEKGNIIWKYRKAQVEWLTRNGFLD
jgi:translation initiation factor 1A